jgi:hypothetical protein
MVLGRGSRLTRKWLSGRLLEGTNLEQVGAQGDEGTRRRTDDPLKAIAEREHTAQAA